ncbi:leucine/isoleucine/valine transporter permease subunit [Chlamydia trachomatis]|nr:leucine/isoleucine/valine transporter permease subunit [Chlamydia trachomatis]
MQNFDDTFNVTLTGGAKGLTGIPSFTNFINTSVLVVITIFVIHTLMKSRWGRAIYAIRDNEIAAEASGISITMYKTTAFVLSAFFAGVAGVLYAGCIGVLAPAKFGFMKSVEILVMVVLGGMGSMLGSILSATTLTVLPELLRGFSDYRMIAYSVVLILVMIFRPKGLFGSYDFSLSRILGKLMLKVRGTSNKKEVSAHE